MSPLTLVFRCKKDQIYTRHCRKETSKLPQHQNKHLNVMLLTIAFPSCLLNEQRYSSHINHQWKWIILFFLKIIECFWKKKPSWQSLNLSSFTSAVDFFSKVCMRIFSYEVCNCQVSDCDRYLLKKRFQSLSWSLLNHLYHFTNRNISVTPLSNLHYLCFNYHSLAQEVFRLGRILLF